MSDTDIRWARQTISRFYAGETTIGDERRLQTFFDAHVGELPDDLAEEIRVFSLMREVAPEEGSLSKFAEEYIDTLAKAEKNVSVGRKVRHRLWISMTSVAAVALVLVIASFLLNDGSGHTSIAESVSPVLPATVADSVITDERRINHEKSVEAVDESVTQKLKSEFASRGYGITYATDETDVKEISESEPAYIEVTDSAEVCRILETSLRLVAEQVTQARDAAEMAQSALIDNLRTVRDLTTDRFENNENDNVI